ncbi:urease accessory protein UreH [Peribacillus sp. B2I2]|uniref:urease accessory protein UreD n=1 Tax=Peribacillus sp. B2I2 TaxID=3156468 RepID=UPI0035181845
MSWTGSIRLKAVLKNDRTIVKDTYYDGAFKLSRPVFLDELSPTYFLIHVGGGYVGGDKYHQLFCLEEGATMTLTTQSATKIYKTMDEPAVQGNRAGIKKGEFSYLCAGPCNCL